MPWHLVRMGHWRKNAAWCAMWRRHHEASQAQRKCVNNMGLTRGKLQVARDLQVNTCHGQNTLRRERSSKLATSGATVFHHSNIANQSPTTNGSYIWNNHIENRDIHRDHSQKWQRWGKTAPVLTIAHVNFERQSNDWTCTCFGMHLLFQMRSQLLARKTDSGLSIKMH